MHVGRLDVSAVGTGRSGGRLAGAAIAGALLVGVTARAGVPATVGLAVLAATAIVGGRDVVLGGLAGLFAHDVLRGAVGYWTAVDAAWFVAGAAVLLWLVPIREPPWDRSAWSVGLAAGGAAVVGVAAAGWVAFATGGQRFAVAAVHTLPAGVALIAAVGTATLTATAIRRREAAGASVGVDGGLRVPSATPGWRLSVLVLGVGLAWLAVAAGLDVLVHDLSQFPTGRSIRRYAEGLAGTGSTPSRIARAVLIGLYRYGDTAVVLVSTLAVLTIGGLYVRSGGRRASGRER